MDEKMKKDMEMDMDNMRQSMKRIKDRAGDMPGMEEMRSMMGRLEQMLNDLRNKMTGR